MDLATLLLSLTLQIVEVQRPRITESITVSGAVTSISTPAAVTVLGQRELESTPSATLDDTLRAVPGFSLFRRSSSRVANPTTQGVTLRGLAAVVLVLEVGRGVEQQSNFVVAQVLGLDVVSAFKVCH